LFSGIGGLELGFEREGFRTAWFIEKSLYCRAVLRRHWPRTRIYDDVSTVDFGRVRHVDVLTGGFPCQDVSTAGPCIGIGGSRSSLWRYYWEAIRILRPRVALVENVPNLANLGLDVVLADLAEVGYDAEWFTLRASDFGAPHRRERLFIVAYPDGQRARRERCVPDCDADAERELSRPAERREGAAQPGVCPYAGDNPADGAVHRLGDALAGSEGRSEGQPCQEDRRVPFVADDFGDKLDAFSEELLQGQQGFKSWQGIRSVEDIAKRSSIPKPLIRRGDDGFSSRLDKYRYTQRIQAIGNAVVPQVAQFIARRIKEVIF
jgi:DNA (cytosine-5)-methyltransferase 1